MDWEEFRQRDRQNHLPLVIAHRGVPVAAPENSLASFALAQAAGADVLETDLRISADDEIMVFHDPTLTRMSDGEGPLFAQTLAQLKQRRLRAPDGSITDERIPTLVELLAATQGEMPLLLELKDWRFTQPRHARRLVEVLDDYGVLAKSAIISFNQPLVDAVRRAAPQIPVGLVTLFNPLPLGSGQLLGPWWPLLYLNPAYVTWAHARGRIVAPLDTTPDRRVDYYLRLGVDAVLADDPAKARTALQRAAQAGSTITRA